MSPAEAVHVWLPSSALRCDEGRAESMWTPTSTDRCMLGIPLSAEDGNAAPPLTLPASWSQSLSFLLVFHSLLSTHECSMGQAVRNRSVSRGYNDMFCIAEWQGRGHSGDLSDSSWGQCPCGPTMVNVPMWELSQGGSEPQDGFPVGWFSPQTWYSKDGVSR